MEYRPLGSTGIAVSLIGLGTMTWGQQNTEADAHAQMDLALEAGINLFDTAEMYAIPISADTQGLTEQYIGSWFAKRKNREQVILATKVAGPSSRTPWLRDGKARLDRANVIAALDASLKRLQTDYIDLYQIHWPERDTNNFGQLGYTHNEASDRSAIPLEETLIALEECVQAGKVRHIGVSNETPWGVMHALGLHRQKGLPRLQSIQNPYSLLNRSYEVGLAEISIREQCGLLAYSPLAFGQLSGKYLLPGATGRIAWQPRYFTRYQQPHALEAIKRYVAIARAAGLSPVHMALAFINQQPFVTSTLIGATTVAQLHENIASVEITLPQDLIVQINQVHAEISNPCP